MRAVKNAVSVHTVEQRQVSRCVNSVKQEDLIQILEKSKRTIVWHAVLDSTPTRSLRAAAKDVLLANISQRTQSQTVWNVKVERSVIEKKLVPAMNVRQVEVKVPKLEQPVYYVTKVRTKIQLSKQNASNVVLERFPTLQKPRPTRVRTVTLANIP